MNKKTKIVIIGIIALVLVTIGITYAYWLITRTQQGENVITTGCLDITLSGENDITLGNQFPISDEDGMKLTPYTFTVTNNCNTSVDYQIALEALEAGDEISSDALKVALDDTSKLYSEYSEVDATESEAYESRKMMVGTLTSKDTEGSIKTHELRVWIDANAPISEMNKTFRSKITVTAGQGIENPIKEGTLAYSILSNYGESAKIQIINEELSEIITTTGDLFISPSYNYSYGTEYSFDEETGEYKLDGDIVSAKLSECRSGQKTCGKYIMRGEKTKLFEIIDFKNDGNYVIANTIEYTTPFGKPSQQSDAGLYKTQDDLGDSYYFRGAPTDNYVKFGTYAEDAVLTVFDYDALQEKTVNVAKGDSMYWRIVRINGDGSIRLIYDGIEKVENGKKHISVIDNSVYNSYNNAQQVGYTYDNEGINIDSTIKSIVDKWYEENLKDIYGDYMADGIFCNDQSGITEGEHGYTYYAPYYRIINKTPKLTCANKSDRYTVDDTTNGNGLLINPVGLITADELMFAGSTTGNISNTSFYLYSGAYYWTLTPPLKINGQGEVWTSTNSGEISSYFVNEVFEDEEEGAYAAGGHGVRPVINLKSDVQFTGNGTIDSPYEIVTE